MPRILGVEIPSQKRGEIALTHLFGIGRSLSRKILEDASIDINKKAGEWTDEELKKIREIIDRSHTVEGDLITKILLAIKRLKDINCYRGIRHRLGLPMKKNTKTNAQTCKKRGKPIASKRKNSK